MKPFRGSVWVSALLLLATAAAPTQAAWCNVFQVTCCHKFHRAEAAASYYAPATVYSAPAAPSCQPCPPVCTTRYVQRCYYQPVVSYQQRSYYEPVTTYRTSYYYEPVTSYRYSSYYDPCTCSYQQVACPTKSYRLRSQTCAVQSWVQRCCSVPVTSYKQCSYWEPVTTCCTPTPAPACPPQDCTPVPGAPATTPPPPAGTEPRVPGAPGVTEYPSSGGTQNLPFQRYYPPPPSVPPASGSSYQPLPPGNSVPQRQSAPAPLPPSVHLDRIVAIPLGEIEGQVVGRDKLPSAGAQLLFVSAEPGLPRQTAAADRTGHFRVALASGSWLVYLQGGDGKPIFQHKVQILENETRQVNLVNG